MTEAEFNYKWGKKANKLTTIFSMIGQTSNLIGNLGMIGMASSGGAGSGAVPGNVGSGIYGGGATDLANMNTASALA